MSHHAWLGIRRVGDSGRCCERRGDGRERRRRVGQRRDDAICARMDGIDGRKRAARRSLVRKPPRRSIDRARRRDRFEEKVAVARRAATRAESGEERGRRRARTSTFRLWLKIATAAAPAARNPIAVFRFHALGSANHPPAGDHTREVSNPDGNFVGGAPMIDRSACRRARGDL